MDVLRARSILARARCGDERRRKEALELLGEAAVTPKPRHKRRSDKKPSLSPMYAVHSACGSSMDINLLEPFTYFCDHIKLNQIEVRPIKLITKISVEEFLAADSKRKQATIARSPGRGHVPGRSALEDPYPSPPQSPAHQIFIKTSAIGLDQTIDLDVLNIVDYVTEGASGNS